MRLPYPDTRKDETADDYFGTTVPDPYRWLEDPNSPDTAAWVDAQNRVTEAFLEAIPARERIRGRLTALWDYERYGPPSKEGPWYVFAKNDGLQNQPVIYKTAALDEPPEVLLDPNSWSADGTAALGGLSFTDDGARLAYAVTAGGSDWLEWRVRDVVTGTDLPDRVRWSKFSGAAWLPDGSGFFYSRYDEPAEATAFSEANRHQKLYLHRLGTAQADDALVLARPDCPDWGFSASVTDDQRYLLVVQWEGTHRENRVFVKDLADDESAIESFLDRFDARYTVVGNDGARFYVLTDQGADRGRVVAIDRERPDPADWTTILPEPDGQDVIADAVIVGPRLLVVVRHHAHDALRLYDLAGRFEREVALPALGSVGAISARRRDREVFYAFTSWTYPTTIYRYDPERGTSTVFRAPRVDFDPAGFETTQVFYRSKDGTLVPMFLVSQKGLARTGDTPTLLYGYGGFDISLTPAFSPTIVAWLELGGLYAVANLRGGGEYGKAWHEAGRLANKQTTFDDAIAAAEFLIREGYTRPAALAINGASNGGLLVGAVMTQRPDLFAAAVPEVGVLDMLRFHRFTIGWAWASDYGTAETREGFDTLVRYSPLHNVRPGTAYPATLVTTADHDDRVVPAHSHKFAATLQAAQGGDRPILARIETRAGHGAGKPTTKQIEERTDVLAFLARALGLD